MDKYVISLGKKPGEFDLIIEGSIKDLNRIDEGGWPRKQKDKVRIRKRANGKLVSDVFTGVPAAALLFSIKIAKKEGKDFYISASTTNWPSGKVLKDEPSKKIAAFLEEYAPLFHRDPGIGTKWLGSTEATPYVEYETQDTEPDTEDLIKEEIKFSPSDPSQNAAHTPDDDRPVTPRKLWEAGRRTYLQSKAGGGRFRLLDIEEQIMPFYSKDDKRAHSKGIDLPIQVRIGNSKDESPLAKAIETTQGNLYLIGEGGIGKTTALFRIMEQHYKESPYDPNGEIPLFVALNRAPISFERWYNDPNGFESRFIRMEIGRQLLGCDELWEVPEEYVQYITKELKESPADGKPRYLLLLDGLNEVSVDYVKDTNRSHQINGKEPTEQVRQLIIGEIWKLFNEYPNVRIILTSRTDEINFIHTSHPTEKLYLTGLKEKHIRGYLEKKKFTKTQIDAAIANERLLECLVIPLFLTMYADLRDVSNVSSRGEILSKFFHERGGNIAYAQQDVIEKLKSDTCHLWFILDFLLPAIGHEMEKKGVFEIRAKEIAAIINPILKGMKPTSEGYAPLNAAEEPYDASAIGEYGKECFDKYRTYGKTVKTIAKEILDKSDVTEYVVNCSLDILKILYNSNGKYCFIHHHFRDYFAAVHDINMLRIAVCAFEDEPELAFESLAPFRANPNHREKSIFIGEILGERHNAPVQVDGKWKYNVPDKPCDRNLIKRALDIFRGRFGDEVGYGVYNLIEILKLVREDLSGSHFSGLDQSLVTFNGIQLGHNLSHKTDFCGSKVRMNNLLCQGHSDSIESVAFAPDGKTFLSGSADHTIRLWDSATCQCLRVCEGHNDSVRSVVFSPNGSIYLSGSNDHTIRVWDSATGQCLCVCKGHTKSVESVAFSLDSKLFLSGSKDRTIRIWDSSTGKCIRVCKGHSGMVASVAFAPDGKTFISGSDDHTIRIWESATGRCLHVCIGHSNSVAFAPNGKTFLSGSKDRTVKIWDSATGQCLHVCKGHYKSVESVAYAPDGKTFLSGSWDTTIRIWDSLTWQCLRICEGHSRLVTSVAFAPNGKTFLSGTKDIAVRVWDSTTGQCIGICRGNSWAINSIAFAPDGKTFLSGSKDRTVKVWDSTTGQCLCICEDHADSVTSVSFSPDSKTFLSGSWDKTLRIWDTSTGQCLIVCEGHSKWIRSVAFAPDGKTFLSGSWDKTVRVWDSATGKCLRVCEGHSRVVTSIAFSPDGKTFLSGAADNTVRIWNCSTGKCLLVCKGHSNWIRSVAFAPDGNIFISGSADHTVRIWDNATRQCIHVCDEHSLTVTSVAFAPDGKTFISGSLDNTIRVWDSATGQCLLICEGHTDWVQSVAFALDGKTFLSGSLDGTIRRWSSVTGECISVIHNYPGLIVFGCDMRNLHEGSDVDKEILRQYGAIVD